MKKIIFIILFFIFCFTKKSSAYFELDNNLQHAYALILELHLGDAYKLLHQEKIEKPGNDLRLLYLNYIDFLKAFISEEKHDFKDLINNSSLRIDEINRNKENFSSPYYLFIKSEILIQQALVRIKFGDKVTPAGEIIKAYKLINKNEAAYPDFILNKKVSGLLSAIIGSVPERFKWALKLSGMKGDIMQGLDDLRQLYPVLNNSPYSVYQPEILFYIGTIYSTYSSKYEIDYFLGLCKPLMIKNPLLTFVCSTIFMKQGKNEEALEALNKTISDESIFPFVFLHYKRGIARLRKLDLASEEDFNYYLKNYRGENYIRSCYQKLAWIALIRKDTAEYKRQMHQCMNDGSLVTEEDQAAEYEAENNEFTNTYLLRSRLLFDGGYYNNALSEITERKIEDFPRYNDQLEVTYRLGRIMQMKGQTGKAISYFKTTIKNGASSDSYFAANSALMIGIIYEERDQNQKAIAYFKKCISLNYKQYKNSIDQKARAGLDRIKLREKKN